MAEVFISYARSTAQQARAAADALRALGYSVWVDDDLPAHRAFSAEIEAQLTAARAALVIWSQDAARSDWVLSEANRAREEHKLVQLKVDQTRLPMPFDQIQCADLAGWAGDLAHPGWKKVAASVIELIAAPAAIQAAQTDPKAAWSEIEASLDARDYADFHEVFAHSELAFEARRRRRKLEDWASIDQTDLTAVLAFLRSSGSFAALHAVVQRTTDSLTRAADRTRLLSLATSTGLAPSDARAAALAKRNTVARSFAIYLPEIAAWPNPTMVAIPPGRFMMGSPTNEARHYEGQEEPQREVKIDHVFALGLSAVTVDAFSAFIADTNRDMGTGAIILTSDRWEYVNGRGWRDPGFTQAGNHPVTCVSWHDAQAFIAWLNDRLRLGDRPDAFRLPSEAEWEYGCRAGTRTPFSFGSTITTDQANYNGNVGYGDTEPSMVWRKATTPVGMFPPNAFGLYDMHGNVWEWCALRRSSRGMTDEGAPMDGSAVQREGPSTRSLRGGSWDNAAEFCRAARRIPMRIPLNHRSNGVGFRLARTLPPPDA